MVVEPFNLGGHEPKKLGKRGLGERPSKDKRARSIKQEDRVAKAGGGFRQPASGALSGVTRKGDVKGVANYLIECKRSDRNLDQKGVYLSHEVLLGIEEEAAHAGKTPVLQIDLDGRPKGRKRWFLVPDDVFYESLAPTPSKE